MCRQESLLAESVADGKNDCIPKQLGLARVDWEHVKARPEQVCLSIRLLSGDSFSREYDASLEGSGWAGRMVSLFLLDPY